MAGAVVLAVALATQVAAVATFLARRRRAP